MGQRCQTVAAGRCRQGSQCCHGAVAECGAAGARGGSGCATSLPAGLAAGASLNASAWALAGAVVSTEARAFFNQGKHGLGCFAPNVNPY
jgi:beta-glucosidase-like glycosyl hydrolase